MGIMTAGMHDADILRPVVKLVFFGDRQSVHVRPQHQHRPGLGAFEQGDNACPSHSAGIETQFAEIALYRLGSAIFFKPQFGVSVKFTPQIDQLAVQFGNPFSDLIHLDAPSSRPGWVKIKLNKSDVSLFDHG